MIKTTMRTLPAMLLLAFSGLSAAAGFQALEQNASGLGTAYAGSAAIADNASTVFFNPAGMTQLSGVNVSFGVVGVSERHDFHPGGVDGGENTALPNAYLTWQLTPNFSAGIGVSRPFRLNVSYPDNWLGAASGTKSEQKTVNVNPSVAYKLNDKVSLGLGLNYQRIEEVFAGTGNLFKGDDSAFGWNAGALFTLSPAMRVGVAYRSKIEHELSGRDNGVPVRADTATPGSFTLSVWQQVSDRWEAMGDLAYTRWTSLDSRFDNAWRLGWGAAYKYSDSAKLKFGVAYDRSPIRDRRRSVLMPDNDSLWLSLGGQWKFGRASVVDVGYAYRYQRDAKVAHGAAVGKYENGAHVVGVQYSVGF